MDVVHVGEFGHRRIVFDVATGDVWVRVRPARRSGGDLRALSRRP